MADDRAAMDAALRHWIVPELRRRGFTGSPPHFRRVTATGVDLIMFQFDRWGGRFAVELARCSAAGFVTATGNQLEPSKVRASHLPGSWRWRLGATERVQDHWFGFDGGHGAAAVKDLLDRMAELEAWYAEAGARGEPPRQPASYL